MIFEDKYTKEQKEYQRKKEAACLIIDKLLLEYTQTVLNRSNDIYQHALDEHKRDVDGFVFQCSKFGQFLTLSIARNGNDEKYERDYTTSVNIKNISHIRLIEGRMPNFEGTVYYWFNIVFGDDNDGWTVTNSLRYPEPIPVGTKINFGSTADTVIPAYRKLFNDGTTPEHDNCEIRQYGNGGSGEYYLRLTTPHYPRAAADDRIEFTGIKSTLFVPYGCGKEVLKKILEATA